MKKEIIVCDTCDKNTHDIYSELGWIIFNPGTSISNVFFTLGRRDGKNSGNAKSKSFSISRDLHFCSLSCFNAYFAEKSTLNI